jgi:hypothetical protein
MKQDRSQEGFSLIAVISLALLATFAAFFALRVFQQETKTMAMSEKRDHLEQALDAGLDKAVYQLNAVTTTPSSWSSIATTGGYASLTCTGTAFTDIPGVMYWIKVLNGKRVPPKSVTYTVEGRTPNANDLSITVADFKADALANIGDWTFDRTIIIMARAMSPAAGTSLGTSLTAIAYVHRNDVITSPQVQGLNTQGVAGLGGSTGNSIPCGATSLTQTGCNGSINGGGGITGGGNDCLTQSTVAVPFPPNTLPASGLIPWNIESTVVGPSYNYTAPNGNNSFTYTLAADTNLQVGNVDLNNDDFHIITNGYTLKIYCTGTFGASGNPNWLVDDPPTPGGHSERCWVYVVGSGAVTLGGNGNYELVVVAPQSAVTVNGTGDIFGAIVANTFDKNGSSGSFHFNECILQLYKANTYTNPPIVNAGWSQF